MSKKPSAQMHVNSGRQMTKSERVKAMEECLKVAAQIRQDLTDREHSNSTDLTSR